MDAHDQIEGIDCALSPYDQRALERAVAEAPLGRRVDVALAWSGLDAEEWATAADLEYRSVHRWIRKHTRLPFGAAYRLAAVMGVPAETLFAGYLK